MPKTEKERRHQAILMRLLRDGRVSTQELAAEFGISDVATRGDFDEIGDLLKTRGFHLHKMYGGAELIQENVSFRGFYEGISDAEMEANELLSAYVVSALIKDWDRPLLLDSGPTIDGVAHQIVAQHRTGLRIMTNSYAPHIFELYTQGDIEVAQLGGIPVPRAFCYVECPDGDEFYKQYWAGPFKTILTGSGFHPQRGLLVNNHHIIEMKQRFIKASAEILLVLDHTKFNKTATGTVTFCGREPDPWLIEHTDKRRENGLLMDRDAIPLTIVTDIPSGQRTEDHVLAREMNLAPHTDGKVCLFKTEIPLTVKNHAVSN